VAVTIFVYQQTRINAIEIDVQSGIANIKDTYGVNVHYRYDAKLFFAKQKLPPMSTEGSDIGLRHTRSLLATVEQFLSRYPKDVVKKNLSDIFLVNKLEFYGKRYGGTYTKSAIYIGTKGKLFRQSNASVITAMHAEFSSILFHNYKFPEEAWQGVNQPGWRYEGNGFEMLGREDLYDQTAELFRNGFLEKYSQSSLENDFNRFVGWAFTKPDRLRELASRYEKINRKCRLVIEFFESVDPRIDIPRSCNNL
jgi:Putative zinc-binding metallo-peptidase